MNGVSPSPSTPHHPPPSSTIHPSPPPGLEAWGMHSSIQAPPKPCFDNVPIIVVIIITSLPLCTGTVVTLSSHKGHPSLRRCTRTKACSRLPAAFVSTKTAHTHIWDAASRKPFTRGKGPRMPAMDVTGLALQQQPWKTSHRGAAHAAHSPKGSSFSTAISHAWDSEGRQFLSPEVEPLMD